MNDMQGFWHDIIFSLLPFALLLIPVYFLFPRNGKKEKLKGRIFIRSQQDLMTPAIKTQPYSQSSVRSPVPADPRFGAEAFPSEMLATGMGDADTVITLTWGYLQWGSYQGIGSIVPWTHTCSVKVKTRTLTFGADSVRELPALQLSLSSSRNSSNEFGNAEAQVIELLKKLPFEQKVVCPKCKQEIYPSDSEVACPECGLPSRKNILKKVTWPGLVGLIYISIGILTLKNPLLWATSFGMAAVFLLRAGAAAVRGIRAEREFPRFHKVELPLAPLAVDLDKQKVDQFYRSTAEAWSAGRLEKFRPKSGLQNISVEEHYKLLSTGKSFKPVKGNALWALFTLFSPPSADEFLVSIGDEEVITNKRLVINCRVPGDYQEIDLTQVRKADFRKSRQGRIKFTMNSGKIVELSSGGSFYVKFLKKLVRRGAFTHTEKA